MRRYHHLAACYLPALAVVAVLIATPRFQTFAIGNLLTQAVLFTVIAALPAHRTRRMSYVDIAWPWGLVAIAVQVALRSPRFGAATAAVTAAYLAIGLRMGLPGLLHLVRAGPLRGEFARYRYQRIRWAAAGWKRERVPMQLEIFLQGLANASVLALPAGLLGLDRDQRLAPLQLVALGAWAGCWSLEWLADRQKRRFAAAMPRGATCDAGLWRHSRHPNYFFQWLGWDALALAATAPLLRLSDTVPPPAFAVLALGLIAGPAFMLWTLLHLTGIEPAEHYSLRRRPDYAEYQRTTNRFLPGPRRPAEARAGAREARA